jgi:hypothetical protein
MAAGIHQIGTGHSLRFLSPIHLRCRNDRLRWLGGGICRKIARHIGVDDAVGWIKPAERACSAVEPKDVDLIMASGPPFSGFTLAERLSRKLFRPYILDYRDPWSELPGVWSPMQARIVKSEAGLLHGAAAVTTVSPSWATDLAARFNVGSKLEVVTNGYDEEELRQIKPYDFGHAAIVYAGIFYPPDRVLTPVLKALKILDMNGQLDDCYFHYYGDHSPYVKQEASKIGIEHRVKLHGLVARDRALAAIKGAKLSVVITSVQDHLSPRMKGWIPAKLFESIAFGSATLLIAPAGGDAEIIAQASGVACRVSGNDVEGIRSFIQQVILGRQFERRNIEDFAWQNIANTLDNHLRKRLPVR